MSRTKVIACATVIGEMLPLLSPDMTYQVLDFGLHLRPENLRTTLQEAIDAAESSTVILGYGLCSMAVVGLRATNCTLIVPRVDDCIAIFLGSRRAYVHQARKEPGTYYLSRGWIEVSDTLLEEYERAIASYGQRRAERMMGLMLKHYTRLAYINTAQDDQAHYREYAHHVAETLGLRYEELPGSNTLIKKMLHGPWDDEFVVARPGETISYLDFKGVKRA